MKNCTGINCIMQYGTVDPKTCCAVSYCPYATPPMTNADRIRAMTDEELAKAMSKLIGFPCDGCPVKTLCKQMPNDASCITVLTVWLKEEAEE